MEPRPSHPVDSLPNAVRARTILAGSHHAWVESLGAGPEPSLVGVVDVDGAPNVLLNPGEDLLPGRVRLTCTEVADDVGVLTVTGELGPGVPAVTLPDVVTALHVGGLCAVDEATADRFDECPWCPATDLTVMPMEVTGLRVVPAGGGPGAVRPADVDPRRFRTAAPDHWVLHGDRAVRHLEDNHQPELLAVARAGGVSGVTGVSVRTADADGVVLTCFGPDGLADVVLPFTPPLLDPRELVRRLDRA